MGKRGASDTWRGESRISGLQTGGSQVRMSVTEEAQRDCLDRTWWQGLGLGLRLIIALSTLGGGRVCRTSVQVAEQECRRRPQLVGVRLRLTWA